MEKVHKSLNAQVQALGVLTAPGCHCLQALSVDRTRELSCQLLQREKKTPPNSGLKQDIYFAQKTAIWAGLSGDSSCLFYWPSAGTASRAGFF